MAFAIRERIDQARNATWPAPADFDEPLRKARRAITDVRHASEDALAGATLQVRRHPFRAVAIAAGAGVAFGTLCGVAATVIAGRLRRATS